MANKEKEEIPFAQQLYDRPFFWLIAGMVTMVVFYTAWGLVEIINMPKGTLP